MSKVSHVGRRRVLLWISRLLALFPVNAMAAGRLKPTPSVSIGPFYPPDPSGLPFIGTSPLRPLPEGGDLTAGLDGLQAEGERLKIVGRVMDTAGHAVVGALIEIWQVDARGHYAVETRAERDPGFAGYGTQVSDGAGRYAFTTIRPRGYGRYGGLIRRTAHIHMRVSAVGREPLCTEIWFDGEAGNDGDTFASRIRDAALRARMHVRVRQVSEGPPAGVFDVVLPNS